MSAEVQVRGGATNEELGALLAVLSRPGGDAVDADLTGYEAWRRNRLRVLRSHTTQPPERTSP